MKTTRKIVAFGVLAVSLVSFKSNATELKLTGDDSIDYISSLCKANGHVTKLNLAGWEVVALNCAEGSRKIVSIGHWGENFNADPNKKNPAAGKKLSVKDQAILTDIRAFVRQVNKKNGF